MSWKVEPNEAGWNILVVPTYNCGPQIAGLIDELAPLALQWNQILFVDNGSSDDTLKIICKKLKVTQTLQGKVEILRNSENIGLGGTHKLAFGRAISRDYSSVTILHGDHQAQVGEGVLALEHYLNNPGTFVLGTRFMRDSKLIGYSKSRKYFNYVMNVLLSLRLRTKVYDLGSGLNVFP